MSKEKTHQDYVYVVGNDDKPLMPTKQFGMVRWMLDTAKATVLRRQPFTIKLNYETTHYVQPVSVGMDTGYAHLKELKLVKSILPVREVSIEVASFDTQKMMNPDISGIEIGRASCRERV